MIVSRTPTDAAAAKSAARGRTTTTHRRRNHRGLGVCVLQIGIVNTIRTTRLFGIEKGLHVPKHRANDDTETWSCHALSGPPTTMNRRGSFAL